MLYVNQILGEFLAFSNNNDMSTSSARRSGVEADGGALQVLRIRGVEDKKVSHPLPYPVCGGVPSSYVLLGALFVNQRRISSRNSKRRWSGYNCAPQYLVESTVKYDRKARRNDDAYVERVVQEVVQAELAKREEGRQSIRAISWCRASRRSCEVKMEKELTRAGSVSSSAGAASGASSTRR